MFGAVCCWAAYTLIGRGIRGLTPLSATTYASLFGTAMLALAAAPGLPAFDPAVLSVSVVAPSCISACWARPSHSSGTTGRPGARTGANGDLQQPRAGLRRHLRVLLLGEPLSASMVIGGALAVSGVMLVSRA